MPLASILGAFANNAAAVENLGGQRKGRGKSPRPRIRMSIGDDEDQRLAIELKCATWAGTASSGQELLELYTFTGSLLVYAAIAKLSIVV
jgi:hypothetical protein